MSDVADESGTEVCLVPDAPVAAEEFGIRVVWQSEQACLEAAEFMIATRMQEDVRRRVAKVVLDLRELNREKFSTFVAQHTNN